MNVFSKEILQNKVALITGGATGIGLQIAHTLAAHGASVFICSRKEPVLQRAVEELLAAGFEAAYGVCDIRQADQVECVIEQLLNHYGRLDFVINNAAGNFPAPISGISYNGFKSVVDIDLLGTYNVTKASFERYLKANGGSIVNISAPFQQGGAAYQSHVAAAKAGVDSLTRSSAVEFGPYGIRVNAVAPGATADTEGMQRFTREVDAMEVNNPLGAVGHKSDIANAVLFLLSDAASYITGQVLVVDGGASIDLFKLGKING